MLFNSHVFLFAFLPIVLAGWWGLAHFGASRARLAFLTLMSYGFYAWFEFPTGLYLLPLLIGSTSVDFVAGRAIARSDDPVVRKRLLVAALTFNLALLGLFKYLGFFTGALAALAGLFTEPGLVPVTSLVLPIGISFYTFNSMSYTIDIYRGLVQPARNVLEYSTFVALFPHLIAGPIVRYSDIDTQLRALHARLTAQVAATGIYFLVVGLFKKLVVADTLAVHVNRLFAVPDQLTAVSGWAAALGYTMQLYFDFSGYSDMAVGLAMLLGFRFPQNFDSPYKAANISDFWRRWHMSLSRWLRDYLYISMGGSRHGRARTLRNLFVTMFLGGLWHGAAWVFVLWGMGHGALLVAHHVASERGLVPRSRVVARTLTFLCVVLLWVPFRAGSATSALVGGQELPGAAHTLRVAGDVLAGMFGARGLGAADLVAPGGVVAGAAVPMSLVVLIAGLVAFVNVAPNSWQLTLRPRPLLAIGLAVMAAWSILRLGAPSPFLYFQF